jgi:hypothetical protein
MFFTVLFDCICSVCRNHIRVLFLFMTYHPVCNRSNTEGTNSGTETTHSSGAPEFTPIFIVGSLLLDI